MVVKKTIALLVLFLVFFSLCGCGGEEPVEDDEGKRLYLSGEDMGLKDASGREGFYVRNEDGTFSPVINKFDGYQGVSEQADPARYLWFTNNQTDISDLIPTASKSSPLCMVYDTDEAMPTEFTLEKYVFRGYTIGCHILRKSDNSLYFLTDDTLDSSYAGEAMAEVDGAEEFRISTINGSDALPWQNVDNNMQLLLGLEKEKYYDFEFFQGTKYRKLTTIADTLVLQSEEVITLKNPYTKTTDGFFQINLPDNLPDGYYYICGKGLFRYHAE